MDLRKGKPSHNPISPHQILKFIAIGFVVFSVIYAINQIRISKYFPINKVQIYGINHLDQQEIQEMLTPLLNRGFFGINVELIRDRLSQIPWVGSISVRRHWPDLVEVLVVEKKAVALWNNSALLSDAGEVFSPKEDTYPKNLAQFLGPDSSQVIMLKHFNEINRILLPLHAKLSYLELTPYRTWKLKLNNGITLQVGHKDILTRLDHFVKVYPKIIGTRGSDVDSIDLRYSNGMAVRWKTPIKSDVI